MKKYFLFVLFKFFYLPWGKLYNWILKVKYGKKYKVIEMLAKEKFKEARLGETQPQNRWKKLWTVVFPEFSYTPDPWYVFFDVITAAHMALDRGNGDCDDFASIALEFFGNNIIYNVPEEYKSVRTDFWQAGYFSLIYKKSIFDYLKMLVGKVDRVTGHTVAVWRRRNMYLIVSNKKFHFFRTDDEFRNWTRFYGTVSHIVEYTKQYRIIDVRKIN